MVDEEDIPKSLRREAAKLGIKTSDYDDPCELADDIMDKSQSIFDAIVKRCQEAIRKSTSGSDSTPPSSSPSS